MFNNWAKSFEDSDFCWTDFDGSRKLHTNRDITAQVKTFISQVEKDAIDRGYKEGWNNAVNMDEWETRLQDAIEKTNKKWVERLAKFSRMGEISEKEVLQDFIKNKSDLLEEKK